MDPIIQINDLSFRPVSASEDVLQGITLDIQKNDFMLLLGPSGCGKSTFVRCLNGLIPYLDEGDMRGNVVIAGKDSREHKTSDYASNVGMVFQNPDDQILSLRVVDEVAWGVENLGLHHDEIVQRVEEYMRKTEISDLKERLTFAISGGQKQKVSIASNLAMRQDVLILDDPTTDLDPVCKSEVVQLLSNLYQEGDKTLIIIEHDLNDLIELCNRITVMDAGKVIYDGPPAEVLPANYDPLVKLGMNMPQHIEVAHALLKDTPGVNRYPILKEEVFQLLKEFVQHHPPASPSLQENKRPVGTPVISIRDLKFAYDPSKPILRGISLDIHQGEFVAIVGANGSGKSTLINNLVGLLHPDSGQVIVEGQDTTKIKISDLAKNIGYVFQNPDHQLFTNTVVEEVGFSLKANKVPEEERNQRIAEALEIVGLGHCTGRHPFSLSRGQRQKLAVATALIHHPRIMLLDEPTTGQDRWSLSGLLDMMTRLNREGNTTIMVTHDMDIVAAYATRVIVVANGQVVMDGRPEDIFYDQFDVLAGLRLRPPTVVDFCRRLQNEGMPRCLTVEDLVAYLVALKTPQEMQPAVLLAQN